MLRQSHAFWGAQGDGGPRLQYCRPTMPSTSSESGHDRAYRTLDGLRGVAALIVMTRHSGDVMPSDLCPESFLAVDLFFLLSGFVVAHAYEARLKAGRSPLWFLRVRLTRLYPLYALGLMLGVTARLMQAWAGGGQADIAFLAQAGVIGALLLPAVPPLPMGGSALDGPTWTLLPELLANLVYAVLVRWLTTRRLWGIVAAAAVALIACEHIYGTLDGGWSVQAFPLIGARLAFSFFLGVLMFRLKPAREVGAWTAWGSVALLALALALHPPDALRPAYELAAVLALFPALVATAIRREPGPTGARVFAALGLASYAAYVLHQPLSMVVGVALGRASGDPLTPWLVWPAFLGGVVVVSMLVDRFYDRPVRRWLAGLGAPCLARSRPQRAGAPA